MLGYASRTGTARNLDALRSCGWGLMVSATGALRTEGFSRYALDNGAWTAHQQGKSFDDGLFLAAMDRLGEAADFVVVPDIVMGGLDSLSLSEKWLPRLQGRTRLLLLAVQNGMEPKHIGSYLSSSVGVFVGGDTLWKEQTLPAWCRLARDVGSYVHVGRVNTQRRIKLCHLSGADSFDGTSATRFASSLGLLDSALRQPTLPLEPLACP